jgi:hypothetical protein
VGTARLGFLTYANMGPLLQSFQQSAMQDTVCYDTLSAGSLPRYRYCLGCRSSSSYAETAARQSKRHPWSAGHGARTRHCGLNSVSIDPCMCNTGGGLARCRRASGALHPAARTDYRADLANS